MGDKYLGVYRGEIADCDDPEQRGRYRVRVYGVYPTDVPVATLPWAEMGVGFASRDTVDIPFFEIGDRVLVLFEQGDGRFPFIMASWVTKRDGLPDLPPEQWSGYNRNRRRWRRQTRNGSYIEWSDLPDDDHVLVRSGGARVRVTRIGDAVEIEAEGAVSLKAGTVQISVTDHAVEAENVQVNGNDVKISSTGDVAVHAEDSVEIGQYVDDLTIPRQSSKVRIGSAAVQIGEKAPTGGRIATTSVIIEGSASVTVSAPEVKVISAAIKMEAS